MKARKILLTSLFALGIILTTNLPLARGTPASYEVQGIYQLTCPTGARSWSVPLAAAQEYQVNLGLFTPGSAHFTLTVTDPWAQAYTFVSLDFVHSKTSDDLYASTFTAPLSGSYTFTLASTNGLGQALQAYFAILSTGPLSNTHTYTGMPLADAHACNLSHSVWTYFVALEGCTTYFIDVARGDPSAMEVPIMVRAKVQALNGLEIPVLESTLLPWEAPECNETQSMKWTGDWFGLPASTTYNLVIEVSGLVSLDPVVVAITVGKEQTHGTTDPDPDLPSSEDTTPQGLVVGLDGITWIGGACAILLCAVAVVMAGRRRGKAMNAPVGIVKREITPEVDE